MALGKKTGGRKKGTPNAKSEARKAEIAAGGEMPLDYALRVMRDETASLERRDWGCSQAMRFCHPALAATEHTGKDGGAIVVRFDATDAKA